MESSDTRRLKELDDANRRLKQIAAEQVLDLRALKSASEKKW
jgi:hypothetical protein